MKRKSAAEIFHEVDPNLKVIPGGIRHRIRKSSLTSNDWDRAGGASCSRCGRESLQFRDGVCPACATNAKERTDQEIEMGALLRSLRGQRARNKG